MRSLLCVLLMLSVSSSARAEDPSDELNRIRRQAREERRKEEQIQMLRLELESLKLEVETRKTMAEMGQAGETFSSGAVPRVSVELKNIVIGPEGARAVVEVSGSRKSVKAGDPAGPYTVSRIDPAEVVLVDAKGVESRAGLRL